MMKPNTDLALVAAIVTIFTLAIGVTLVAICVKLFGG